jgi:hypothetical protein
MPIIDTQVRTITCDGPECTKTITYEQSQHKAVIANPDNAWLMGVRLTQTADGRNLAYCSDVCEVKSVGAGKHNIPEPSKIIPAVNPAAVIAAANAAAQAKAAEQAIREGGKAKVQLTD